MRPTILAASLSALALGSLAGQAAAQCTRWADQFALAGVSAQIADAVIWDDGTGPALYAVGTFPSRQIGRIDQVVDTSAGTTSVSGAFNVAKWDGRNWNIVGGNPIEEFDPLNSLGRINAIEVFDPDGPGPLRDVLVVAGGPNGSAPIKHATLQFNGTTWSYLGQALTNASAEEVRDLITFQGDLYACGRFTTAGLGSIARFDAELQEWVDVGGGIPTPTQFIRAERMAVGDAEGDGIVELYVAGTFTFSVTGGSAAKLVKWNGSNWSTVPGWVNSSTANAANLGAPSLLEFIDIGDGPALLVGDAIYSGLPSPANTRGVALARLKNGTWSTLIPQTASGNKAYPYSATMFNGPAGPQLHVGGARILNGIPGQPTGVRLARRTPAGTFEALGSYVGDPTGSNGAPAVRWMLPVDWDASGPGGTKLLFGAFRPRGGELGTISGLTPLNIALWNGSAIQLAHSGSAPLAIAPGVIKELDPDGTGPLPAALYIAHFSQQAAGVPVNPVVTFDGSGYSNTPAGAAAVVALETFTPAAGTTALYAAGQIANGGGPAILRLNTSAWDPIATTDQDPDEILTPAFDSLTSATINGEPSLIAAGRFRTVAGTPARFVARYNGSDWIAMDAGLPGPTGDPNLIFRTNAAAQRIVNLNGELFALINASNFDNTLLREVVSTALYRWNGSAWNPIITFPDLFPNPARTGSPVVLDRGFGPELFLVGNFLDLHGIPGNSYIARWNGSSFEPFSTGFQFANPNATASTVSTIGVHDFGSGPQLLAVLNSAGFSGSEPVEGLVTLVGSQWVNVDGGRRFRAVTTIASSNHPLWGGLYLGGGFRQVATNNLNIDSIESQNIARLITLPPGDPSCVVPCPCSTDYDQSGSDIPDIDDLLAFFDDFNNGRDAADLNCTGAGSVPDIDDLVRFFEIFNNGCN